MQTIIVKINKLTYAPRIPYPEALAPSPRYELMTKLENKAPVIEVKIQIIIICFHLTIISSKDPKMSIVMELNTMWPKSLCNKEKENHLHNSKCLSL